MRERPQMNRKHHLDGLLSHLFTQCFHSRFRSAFSHAFGSR
jgi:hypothetical protein